MSFFYDRPLWAPTLMPHIQGRRKVWKYGVGGNNVVGIIFPLFGIGLIDLPKSGEANHSSPCPSPVSKALHWKQCCCIRYVKFIYSEKATKFCKISTLLLTTVHTVKSKVEISQNFVAFSEYINFNMNQFPLTHLSEYLWNTRPFHGYITKNIWKILKCELQ